MRSLQMFWKLQNTKFKIFLSRRNHVISITKTFAFNFNSLLHAFVQRKLFELSKM